MQLSPFYLAGFLTLTLGACRYDLDEIFAAGTVLETPDASADAEDTSAPEDLASLLGSGKFSSGGDECQACALQQCKQVSEECAADEACVAFNRCVAKSTDPATQADCRSHFIDWLSEDIPGRDMGGPYQQCAFQDRCSEECKARTNFSCVGGFAWPTTAQSTVLYRIRFVEALDETKVVAGLEVKVCRPDDAACSRPTATAMTDENGEVQLDLRVTLRAFRGYLELKKDGIYPTLLRLGWPIAHAGVTNIGIIDSHSAGLNFATAGVEQDPERGVLQVRFFSCAGLTAPGISFSSELADERSSTWYADEAGLPSLTNDSTSTIGAGGLVNAVEGTHKLVATQKATGLKVAETSAPVRKGFMSIVLFAPLDSN